MARLPLRPSEANALLPLFETVINSLHAIQDRFGDEGIAADGRIDIRLMREPSDGRQGAVIGFEVEDNGIGLNDENYRSFLTPFSMLRVGSETYVGRSRWCPREPP